MSLLFPAIVTITDVNSDTDNTDGMVAMDGGKRKRRYADEGNKKSINCAYFFCTQIVLRCNLRTICLNLRTISCHVFWQKTSDGIVAMTRKHRYAEEDNKLGQLC